MVAGYGLSQGAISLLDELLAIDPEKLPPGLMAFTNGSSQRRARVEGCGLGEAPGLCGCCGTSQREPLNQRRPLLQRPDGSRHALSAPRQTRGAQTLTWSSCTSRESIPTTTFRPFRQDPRHRAGDQDLWRAAEPWADSIPDEDWRRPTLTVSFGRVRDFIPRRGPRL